MRPIGTRPWFPRKSLGAVRVERPAIPGSKFSFAFRVGNAGSSQGAMQERITLVSKSRPAIAIPKRCFVFLRGSTPSIWRLACERRQLHFHTRCGLLRRAGVVATSHPRCSDFRGVLGIHGLVCGLALLIWGQTCPCTSSANGRRAMAGLHFAASPESGQRPRKTCELSGRWGLVRQAFEKQMGNGPES